MGPQIPAGIEEIDDEWLSRAIGAPVQAQEVRQIGQGVGMVSSIYRATLTGDGPGSVIIKMPSLDEAAQFNAAILRLNIREVGFYRELAPECPIRVPTAHYAAVNTETHQFVLVLEDLGSLRFVDQVAGISRDDARRAVTELAGWHLHWWDAAGPIVERGTAVSIHDPIYPPLLPPVFAEGWVKVGSAMSVPESVRRAADGWVEALPRLLASLGQAPLTLVHGDYRADNMLFDEEGRLVLLDFQVIGESTAAGDLAYFVTASLPAELASQVEPEFFSLWRGTLHAGGVPESDTAGMWDRYRAATLFCVCYPMIAGLGMDLTDERTRALLAAGFDRFARATEELNLLDLL